MRKPRKKTEEQPKAGVKSSKKLELFSLIEMRAIRYLKHQTKLLIEVTAETKKKTRKEKKDKELSVEEANERFREMIQALLTTEYREELGLITERLDEAAKMDVIDQYAQKFAIAIFDALFAKKHKRAPTQSESYAVHCNMLMMDSSATTSSADLMDFGDLEDDSSSPDRLNQSDMTE